MLPFHHSAYSQRVSHKPEQPKRELGVTMQIDNAETSNIKYDKCNTCRLCKTINNTLLNNTHTPNTSSSNALLSVVS